MELLNQGKKFYDMIELTARQYKDLCDSAEVNAWLAIQGFSYREINSIRLKWNITKLTVTLFV